MDDDIELPWWRNPLRAAGLLAGLLVLAVLSMAGIFLVARYLDGSSGPQYPAPIYININPPPPPEVNARTRGASTFGFDVLVNSPGQPAGVSFKGSMQGAGAQSGGSSAALPAAAPGVPVGLSVEEYRAAIDSGKKVYLPDPKGECDLSGTNAEKSTNALDNCFAQRAERRSGG